MYHPLTDKKSPPAVYADKAPPPPPTARLDCRQHFDMVVVGAGFTGLSAALHLAQRGVAGAVLQARTVAWGASGRAFGQVVPYLKRDVAQIIATHGPERAGRAHHLHSRGWARPGF
jgi:glycine/D-amino acid oxidase-like deaminating enzyme